MSKREVLEALRDGHLNLDEAREKILADAPRDAGSESTRVPLQALQEELIESLAEALYMESEGVELDQPFTDLGLDSIVAAEWINALNKRYELKIAATRVYDFPTLHTFSEYLKAELEKEGRALAPASSSAPEPASVSQPVATKPVERDAASLAGQPVSAAEARQPALASEAIAIVGMSGRYPDAADLGEFWANLKEGRDSVREIPQERWDASAYYDPDPSTPGKIYCKWLGALDDIDCFDASFFRIPPAEAELMDPQHRIFLEESYRAFEDAGYGPQALDGKKCGVYMGIMNSEYAHMLPQERPAGLDTGNSAAIAAARVAYHLNLRGPALPIDTACSSGLVAVHLACQALRNGEIDMAISGGVTLYLTPASYIGMCGAGMLSPDGRCKSFDDSADGFVPGEGVGLVVLKRLDDAERDGDAIRGVIVGSGINQDGRTNGITAPSVQSQVELLRDVYERFRIDPDTIGYVETHGTGTKLGDPVEFEALTTVFRENTERLHYCGLGAVKSNIGHASAAAGMAGMHKALLSLEHRQLAPSLHFARPNVHCDFDGSPFYLNGELKEWRAGDQAHRRVAVSSFGFSGTNAHLVIEEYSRPEPDPAVPEAGTPVPIVLSARDEDGLRTAVRRLLASASRGGPDTPSLRDIAYTLQVGREAMQERVACRASSLTELTEKLAPFAERGEVGAGVFRGRVPRSRGRLALFEADEEALERIDEEARRGEFSSLLDLWVTGLVFDWERILTRDRPRRVSLPTYAFAKERHWVGAPDAAAKAGRGETRPPLGDKQPTRAAAPRGPALPPGGTTPVSLADPARTAPVFTESSAAKPSMTLRSPGDSWQPSGGVGEEAPVRIDTVEEGDGVVSIRVDGGDRRNRLTRELLVELSGRLRAVCARADVKAVLLHGNGDYFFTGDTSAGVSLFDAELGRMTLESPVPVIAVMKGAASGAGLLLGALCDLMVCSEESELRAFESGADDLLVRRARGFLTERFGPDVAAAFTEDGDPVTGRTLRDLGVGCPLLPAGEVDAHALRLARQTARAPREALTLLKRHLAKGIADGFAAAAATAPGVRRADSAADQDGAEDLLQAALSASPVDPATPVPVDLQSQVVELQVFPAGVALVTMSDAEGCNTFTEALAGGLREAFEHISRTPAIKAVVLTGYGNYFACGGTREALLAIEAGKARFTDSKIVSLPLACDIPVIAALQGHGIGAGWALGMFCDAAVYGAESIYHSPYMEYGFTPGAGSTLVLPARLGHDLAREALLAAGELKGDELQRRGIGTPVLPRAEVLPRALAAAHHLARASRETLVRWKQQHVRTLRERLEATYAAELAMHERTFVGNPDVRARIEERYSSPAQAREARAVEEDRGRLEHARHDPASADQDLRPIVRILRETLAEELHMRPEKIDNEIAFIEMGLDSINSVTWMREAGRRLGLSIETTEVYNHPTILELASHVRRLGGERGVVWPQASPAVETQRPQGSRVVAVADDDVAGSREPRSSQAHRTLPDIAVIGMAGSFPKARDIATFWENLEQGRDCISEIPPQRWPLSRYFDPTPQAPGKSYSKWMGVLEDAGEFDPLFFNISPLEAQAMDPQQRLFLQACWSCLEDAGHDPSKLAGSRCGVYVGCGTGDYGLSVGPEDIDAPALMGGATSILAARISYFLNLQGPCVALDTACSSSLVAIASACDSLALGSADMALAGGVNVMAGPMLHIMTSQAGMLSPDGRCFTFDERANGFVPGEGVGVLLLKRREDAERDGDRIDAVIRGWGVNHDGKTNGITAPNGDSQTRLEQYVYERFGLDPETIQMVEAHGTGTKLGDPIEVAGLKAAFGPHTSRESYCALGSVKSGIGHLLAAAGVAGAIKSILALKHRKLPPTINFRTLNPQIDLEDSPFYINTTLRDWQVEQGSPRRAAVSGFGFSGTNAHVVIEEAAAEQASDDVGAQEPGPAVIVLSARNEERLAEAAGNLLGFVEGSFAQRGHSLQDLAYTLQVGRAAMAERLAFVADSAESVKAALRRYLSGEQADGLYRGRVRRDEDAMSPLGADGATAGDVEQWMAQGEHDSLVELWVEGLDVDWAQLHAGTRRRRLSLPTYPFAREHFWNSARRVEVAGSDEAGGARRQDAERAGAAPPPSTLLCRPVWKESPAGDPEAGVATDRHVVLLCGTLASHAPLIESGVPDAQCVALSCDAADIAERFEDIGCRAFESIKELLLARPTGTTVVQALIEGREDERLLAGLAGLLHTASLENPAVLGQVIELQPDDDIVARVRENRAVAEAARVRYVDGRRAVLSFEEIAETEGDPAPCWRDAGVYLITGGAGGLAAVFSREIATRATRPVIVLAGRSPSGERMRELLDELEAQGARAQYRQVDVADESSVRRLVDGIEADFGRLDAVLHAAGVMRDNFVTKKSAAEFKEVLAAKVKGTVLLERACRALAPELIVLFASCSGVTGNSGQADYAAGNAFMDALAERAARAAEGEPGATRILSIDWPLWEDGGMRLDDATLAALREQTGARPMEAGAGLTAFYRAVASGLSQVVVLSGEPPLLRKSFLEARSRRPASRRQQAVAPVDDGELRARSLEMMRSMLGESINLAPHRIDEHEPLESYGIDSILITRLNQRLARVFPQISQTLLFEVRNLSDLSDQLVEAFPADCARWTGMDESATAVLPPPTAEVEERAAGTTDPRAESAGQGESAAVVRGRGVQEPIAIIGISGRYAQAETLEDFWEVLRSGRDCVTEIPPERWPLDGFYHPDPDEAVKRRRSYSKWGSFLDGFAQFDPLFFNILPIEAMGLDPQERLFLQTSWEVVESAGYTRESLAETAGGSVGVFAGITQTGFERHAPDWQRKGIAATPHTSFGSVPNRVSYLLDLHGPSIPIDTMCSSSLTAIHEACQSLRQGECKMAIAGGVNLYLHPSSYVGLSAKRMLSKDGRCKSFGAGGDGFVPGEGVGAVLLKPLAAALEDGDIVHAVIRGTHVNHGGKTIGYTVPNPQAQSELIRGALDKAGVDARSVTYVEAHGTGTKLGDPIEVAGLTQAFRGDTSESGFCALGSVKSNLGHLEAAAGIAGLTKVVLQMRHGQIAPTLHAEELNQAIRFPETPFEVQRELTDWVAAVDGETGEHRRVAGVSSFGAGGANAHIVVEGPPRAARPAARDAGAESPVVAVLSAKTQDRLLAYAERLHEFLGRAGRDSEPSLRDVAFTLQTGREAMEHRVGFIVRSLEDLRNKLQAFIDGAEEPADMVRGRVERERSGMAKFARDEDVQSALDAWLRKGKLSNLLEVWVAGTPVDWRKLYGGDLPRRIELPTYPFAKETYWTPLDPGDHEASHGARVLHPLVHQNTSDLEGLRFSTVLSDDAPHIADHVVGGQKLLPGVAFLEMARAAAELVSDASQRPAGMSIRHAVWARPIAVAEAGRTVHIGLLDEGAGTMGFEIYSSIDEGAPVVHGQGVVAMEGAAPEDVPALDLDGLRAAVKEHRFDADQCYEAFRAMGVVYGPSHRSIVEVFTGANQVLARLRLPEAAAASGDAFELHPSLMDGALQAAVGFTLQRPEASDAGTATVPFALDELRMFAPCADEMWVWIRPSEPSSAPQDGLKLDFDLVDADGNVRVFMRGFTFRPLAPGARGEQRANVLLAHPVWEPEPAPAAGAASGFEQHHLLICGVDAGPADDVAALLSGVSCRRLPFAEEDVVGSFVTASKQVFELTRGLLEKKPARRVLVQVVVPAEGRAALLVALAGLLRTAALENPLFAGQVIEVDSRETADGLARIAAENAACPDAVRMRYEGGVRHRLRWRELDSLPAPDGPAPPWKAGGVYWITGGAGGLGRIFAQRIVRQVRDVTLILTGRSAPDAGQEEWLAGLKAMGARVEYRSGDVSRARDVERLAGEIVRDHGTVDGVLHAAGVLRDGFVLRKTEEELEEVLAPKVAGAWHLDRATADLNLDFFALFAAGAGTLGNPGQADYATANAFLDALARHRSDLVKRGERSGRTVSIDWPLWQDGGMTMDAASQAAMKDRLGLMPMATEAGLSAFDRALASGEPQLMPLSGDLQRLRALLRAAPDAARAAQPGEEGAPARADTASLQAKAIDYFRQVLSDALQVPEHRLGPDVPFADFGIDSIVVMNLTNVLEETFGSLPKTLFFEYESVAALAQYFVTARTGKLAAVVGGELAESDAVAISEKPSQTGPVAPQLRTRERTRSAPRTAEHSGPRPGRALDIAIVGVAGRYPMAPDLDVYWANLRDGRDCITEVPADRWDWRDYYSDEAGGHSSKWGGFIEDVDKFDPRFFGIPPRTAPFIDPQERLILEETWKALEDAGYRPRDLQARSGEDTVSEVGVYIGSMYGEYQLLGAESTLQGRPMAFAGSLASLANRLSYFLDLHGPSMMVDTMCSSSLTCMHLACQDLRSGRTRAAIAGAVNLTIHPNKYLMLSGGQFISTQGRCESFGEGGDGYIPSEGVGVVVLKRLEDAERDRDQIYAVIKGSALNHGGRTNGYSVPNPNAQRRVIARALREAGVDPGWVSYVEAHGTGTRLGDPIEIAGLARAFDARGNDERCWVGSAKSNIGHCEAAAGVAGLTKILLQMKHGQIAPSIHSNVLNPNIDFDATPFEINQVLRDWKPALIDGKRVPRIAGISSFGAGGANAHMVIEEYRAASFTPRRDDAVGGRQDRPALPALIVLSARTQDRLRQAARNLHDYLDDARRAAGLRVEDVAYTLQVGREPLDQRLAFSVASVDELRRQLEAFLDSSGQADGQLRGHADETAPAAEPQMTRADADDLVERLAEGGDHQAILGLWVAGHDLDWQRYHDAIAARQSPDTESPRRISLPPYPFDRQRYWVDRPADGARAQAHDVAPQPAPERATPRDTATPAPLATPGAVDADFVARMAKPSGLELAPLPAGPQSSDSPAAHDGPVAATDAPPPVTSVEAPPPAGQDVRQSALAPEALRQKLHESLAETLFLEADEIGPDKPFIDLGLDSIVALEWVKLINQEFGLDMAAATVYEHPTLREFTTFVDNQVGGAGETLSQASPAETADPPTIERPEPAPKPRVQASYGESEGIAVVGMSGRFPGGPDLEAFWRLLESGETAFTELPTDRGWDLDGTYHPTPHPAKSYVRRGGFLEEIDRFDPLFFQISPKEARTMDPCERLFLEESWRAIEDAGVDPARLSGRRCGVFCGNGGDYSLRVKEILGFSPHVTLSQVPARVSHSLDLNGPCQSVDAGCASSLLAIAQACDQLVMGRCEVAIAGGALIHSTPNLLVSACQVELLSDGQTGQALDARARGMMPAEAVGVVVLKRLEDALADGDRIHGVIEGWGSNHNGRTNGMVAPNADAEVSLFEDVYERFGIDPGTVTLVEANASGMPLADAAEVEALTRVFAGAQERSRPCVLGTVENNIGHAFHASGMGHLFKALLAMRHQRIPGTPNVGEPIAPPDAQDAPFSIPAESAPWSVVPGQLRRAAVSSFGATGANVHLVVSEPATAEVDARVGEGEAGPALIALSARTVNGLRQRCRDLEQWLGSRPSGGELDLLRLSANLLLRRAHFEQRCAIVASDVATLREQLARLADGETSERGLTGTVEAEGSLTSAMTALATSTIDGLEDPLRPGEKDLLVLAELYTKGIPPEMADCFTAQEKAVLSLPGYPFEKRRCWLTGNGPEASSEVLSEAADTVPEASEQASSTAAVARLTAFVSELTGMSTSEVESAGSLRACGVDSLMGMRLLNRVNTAWDARFDAALLRHDDLDEMAAAIGREAHPDAGGSASQVSQIGDRQSDQDCPAFIERLSFELPDAQTEVSANEGAAQLELLMRQGVGVWRDEGALRCEFFEGTQTRDSLAGALNDLGALHAVLAQGARYYPASQMQRFALDVSEIQETAALNIGQAFWVDGPVDFELLERAVSEMVQHHSILRTGVQRVGDQWAQVVYDTVEVSCRKERWYRVKRRDTFLRKVHDFEKSRSAVRFDADKAPLLEVCLLHNDTDLAAVYFHTHHFHADGFTLFLVQQEIHQRYRALLDGTDRPVAPPRAEYAHFALSQFDPAYAGNTEHWLDRLEEQPRGAVLQDRPEVLEKGVAGSGVWTLEVDGDLSQELLEGSRRAKVTLTQMLACAVGALTYRLSGQSMAVQMVCNLRDRYEFEAVLGDFSSSAPLILEVEDAMTARDVLDSYERAALEIQRHKRFDLIELIKELGSPGSWSGIAIDSNDRDALCEVTDFADRLIDIEVEGRAPVAPLVVCLVKTGGRLVLQLIHDRELLSSRSVELFGNEMTELMVGMVQEPALRLEDFEPAAELRDRLAVGKKRKG